MNNLNNISNTIKLDRVVFFGRTLSDHQEYFALYLTVLQNCKILECLFGADSCVAEVN